MLKDINETTFRRKSIRAIPNGSLGLRIDGTEYVMSLTEAMVIAKMLADSVNEIKANELQKDIQQKV